MPLKEGKIMPKDKPAKGQTSDNKPPEEEYPFTGEMAEQMRRREKFMRTGKIDLKDYPMERQVYPSLFS